MGRVSNERIGCIAHVCGSTSNGPGDVVINGDNQVIYVSNRVEILYNRGSIFHYVRRSTRCCARLSNSNMAIGNFGAIAGRSSRVVVFCGCCEGWFWGLHLDFSGTSFSVHSA